MPTRSKFYQRNDMGAIQRTIDNRIPVDQIDAIVISTSGNSATVQTLGSNKSISVEVDRGISVKSGDRVTMRRSTSVNRWIIFATTSVGSMQGNPVVASQTRLESLTPIIPTTISMASGVTFQWSPSGPRATGIFQLEVADDNLETGGAFYIVSGGTFFVQTTTTKYARVRSVSSDWTYSSWTDWISGSPLTAGSSTGFAPYDAPYWISATTTTLPNAVVLAALGTGLLKNTTGTGVPTIAVSGTDYLSPTGTEVVTNKTIGNTNTVALKDNLFTLQDDGVTTKQAQFQLSGVTAGQTRILTVQDANGTIAYLSDVTALALNNVKEYETAFTYTSTSPLLIRTVLVNERVMRVRIVVSTAFDGTVTLSVGEPGTTNRLMATSDNRPTLLGSYAATPDYVFPSSVNVNLYLSVTGSTQGAGKVILETAQG